MDFENTDRGKAVEEQLLRFMDEYIYPAERTHTEQSDAEPSKEPAIMLDIRAKAKEVGGTPSGLP